MRVLTVTAASEATLGVALLLVPPIVIRLLLGVEASGAVLVAGRVAGIALLALSIACWPERGASDSRAALRGMLSYNALVTPYLVYLGIGGEWVGVLLWPAAGLHAVLTVWCFVAVRRREAPPGGGPARQAAAGGKSSQ